MSGEDVPRHPQRLLHEQVRDAGNGDCVAFFWFPTAHEGEPGDAIHPTYDDNMGM